MSCAFVRLTVWSVRRWFSSDRSARQLAPLEFGLDSTPMTADEAAACAAARVRQSSEMAKRLQGG